MTTGNDTPLQAAAESDEPTQEEQEELARRAAELAAKEAAIQQAQAQAEKEAKLRRERAQGSLAYFTPLAAKARLKWEQLKQDGAGSRIIDAAYDEMREYERGREQAQRELEG